MKIHITGNAGAGKTTIATQLGHELGLKVFGLDKVVWQPGRIKSAPDIRAAKIEDLLSQDEWIIEGVSDRVRDAADIIVFLDVKRATAYLRCAKRNWKYLFRSRPELPDNCPEILIIPRLLKVIWKFNHHVRPKVLTDMSKRPDMSFRVSTYQDLCTLQQGLGIQRGAFSSL